MEEFPKIREGTPFREPLENFNKRIRALKSRPDKLVREGFEYYPIQDKQDLEREIKEFSEGKAFFQELQKNYAINVVSMDCVVGQDENSKKRIFTIVDKIEGQNLKELEELPNEAKEKFDLFYAALIQHYLDGYLQRKNVWSDFGDAQIMYGHKYGENENSVYLTDVDPCSDPAQEISGDLSNSLLGNLIKVCGSMLKIENKFNPPVVLKRAREKFSEIIDATHGKNNKKLNSYSIGILKQIKALLEN